MSRGKAHGANRAYQVLVRDALQMEWERSTPYGGDGIDVEFEIGGTKVTFDVVLDVVDGPVVVAECRRWIEGVKQEALFAFGRKVELLRESLGRHVQGIVVARKRHQRGALKVAAHDGITMIVTEQGQPPKTPHLYYWEYDAGRNRVHKRGKLFAAAQGVARSLASANPTIERSSHKA